MGDKPRCDFYYVLMSEEGEYYELYYKLDSEAPYWRTTGVLKYADTFMSEEIAKDAIVKYHIPNSPRVYKVHSPIIECCELPESKQKELNPANLDVMRKW